MSITNNINNNKVGLFIILTKCNPYCQVEDSSFVCNSLEHSRTQLIDYLITKFNNLNIDFPMELDDFENIWFNSSYVKSNCFNYKIYHNDNWEQPWELQEIYSDVLDKMHQQEIENPPNFSKIYGEDYVDSDDEIENKDETYKKDNNFYNNENKNNDKLIELENKFKDIIKNSQNIFSNVAPTQN
jgi:hypothetical protein